METTGVSAPAGRPPVEAVDRDRAQRPGVPKERPPQPWPNARPHPARMSAPPSVPTHGRPNKQLPPVYSTAVPPRGLNGLIRRAAYRIPDHRASHWLVLMLADRVQAVGRQGTIALWFVLPALAVAVVGRRLLED
jgi:hypothetical protein